MKRPLLMIALLVVCRAESDLELLLRVLPPSNTKITGRINLHDKSWEDWQRRTGEQPPDFAAMKPIPFLPDPLIDASGQPIATAEQWKRQKEYFRQEFEKWFYGRMPPAPENLRTGPVVRFRDGDVEVRTVTLSFGPGNRARLRLQLMVPSGKGPFPVFLTNHPRTRPWVNTAVRRGYLAVIYHAADPIYGDTDDSESFLEAYPDFDFSCLARWAWAAMRAVDYVVTVPEADGARIAITGHSRNGKQALLAAAFDDRIGAVALSSGNTGEGNPWRYTTDAFANESIEQITTNFPHWFHPRLRFFAGREDRLPVDQNSLMAMVAPRGLLLASAYAESQGSPFGFEQAYRSVKRVYRWMGADGKVGLSLRAGEHPTTAEDIEQYIDFFDLVFGRREGVPPETWILGYDFDDWIKRSRERLEGKFKDKPVTTEDVRGRLRWLLGDEPPSVRFPAATGLGETVRTTDGWLAGLYNRPLRIEGARHAPVSFGDDLKADLYLPSNATEKVPAVIWLHSFSYATGYSRYARQPIADLIRSGFAVLAFDQIGFGTRIHSARDFYRRYPHWSLMGKMVADTRAALDALAALPMVRADRIYLVGTGLGSRVALYTCVMEPRARAVAMLGGLAAFRANRPNEGIRQLSHLHGLVPRLGLFAGREEQIPVDDPDVLPLIGSRRVLIVAPELDRYSDVRDVRSMSERARQSGLPVHLETPRDFHRFPPSTFRLVLDWLRNDEAR